MVKQMSAIHAAYAMAAALPYSFTYDAVRFQLYFDTLPGLTNKFGRPKTVPTLKFLSYGTEKRAPEFQPEPLDTGRIHTLPDLVELQITTYKNVHLIHNTACFEGCPIHNRALGTAPYMPDKDIPIFAERFPGDDVLGDLKTAVIEKTGEAPSIFLSYETLGELEEKRRKARQEILQQALKIAQAMPESFPPPENGTPWTITEP